MAWHRAHGSRLDCGCGGEPLPVSWVLVARNGVLAALALAQTAARLLSSAFSENEEAARKAAGISYAELGRKHKVMAPGVIEWGTTPKDFFEKKVAMMWTTTGNLTNVRNNAKFDFGVAMLPAKARRGSPTGGGNFYVFKKATKAQQEAAAKFGADPRIYLTTVKKFIGDEQGNVKQLHAVRVGPAPRFEPIPDSAARVSATRAGESLALPVCSL